MNKDDNQIMKKIQEKLSPGKYWGGYKQICELLDEPVYIDKTAKNQQLRTWSRFFKYEIIKHSRTWSIEKIYDTPKAPTVQGSSNNMPTLAADIIAKIITDDKRKNYSYSWIGTKSSIAKDIGITTDAYYKAKKNLSSTVENVIENVEPYEKNITYNDVSHFFSQTDSRVKYFIEKALDELEDKHVIFYEQKYIIYDTNKKNFHSLNMKNSEDVERIFFYHNACISLMKKYDIPKDDISTLKKHHIEPASYYKELNAITSTKDFTIFKAYVICIIESVIEKYYESKMLDAVSLDDMRLNLYNQFHDSSYKNQKRYTDAKGKSIGIGKNPDDYVSKNYSLVCDYLTKTFKEFKPYNSVSHSLGYRPPSENDIEDNDNFVMIDIVDGIIPILINKLD